MTCGRKLELWDVGGNCLFKIKKLKIENSIQSIGQAEMTKCSLHEKLGDDVSFPQPLIKNCPQWSAANLTHCGRRNNPWKKNAFSLSTNYLISSLQVGVVPSCTPLTLMSLVLSQSPMYSLTLSHWSIIIHCSCVFCQISLSFWCQRRVILGSAAYAINFNLLFWAIRANLFCTFYKACLSFLIRAWRWVHYCTLYNFCLW